MKIAGCTHTFILPNTMQRKELIPSIYYVQSLIQFYLTDGTTTFIQKESKEKTTLKDEGVRLDLLGLYGAGLGRPNESCETVQVTCTLEVPRWSESRRPVPTAASVAAAELGPSAWPASSLRLSSHERAGSRDIAGV